MDKKGGYQDEEENLPSAKDDSKSPKSQSSPPNRVRRERRTDADSKAITEQDDNEAAPSKPRRKRGSEEAGNRGAGVGWMNTSSSPNTKTLNNSIMPDDEALPAGAADAANAVNSNNKNKHFNDNEEEVMIIPDLDEEAGADSDHRIAHAPRNVHRKIPTLTELEAELSSAAVSSVESGMQLKTLTATLIPANMLGEPDEEWTFDSLLREITNELSDVPKSAERVTKEKEPKKTAEGSKSGNKSGGKKSGKE